MADMRHAGRITNTGGKCIVVFREIYDQDGKVSDPDHCLVVETERLPDMEHDDIIRILESPAGQEASQFYEIAHRTMFSDGLNMLTKLHNRGYLRKYPTSQVEFTPNPNTAVTVKEINDIIRKQNSGLTEEQIKNTMVDDTDKPPRTSSTTSDMVQQSLNLDPSQTIDEARTVPGENVLDDSALAKNMLKQAETYLAEAKRLQKDAYDLAPDLRPAPKRKSTKKTPTKEVVDGNS